MELQYHQSAFELIGKVPIFSEDANAVLDQLEQRYEFRFPASLREWYSIHNILEMFFKYSWGDPVEFVQVEKLIPKKIADENASARRYRDARLIVFKTALESDCQWAILLDGSDDPPVLFEDDTAPPSWEPIASSFSEWCYSEIRFWLDDPNEMRDWQFQRESEQSRVWRHQHSSWLLTAYDSVSNRDLDLLRQHFQQGPLTRPSEARFFFQSATGDQQLVLDDNRWFLWAQTEESLLQLTNFVWSCGNLAEKLHDVGDHYTDIPQRLRASRPY